MGHAGAIISRGVGGAADKIKVLEAAGVTVVKNPAEVGLTVAESVSRRLDGLKAADGPVSSPMFGLSNPLRAA